MNKSGLLKSLIGLFLILIIVVATVSYGKNQRSKISLKDDTKATLPTVQDNSADTQNKQPSQEQVVQPKAEPAPVVSAPVQAQNTQGQMPATGPVDTTIPVLVLGTLSGMYLVGRRRLKQLA